MLSRKAHQLYWMHRYIERIENYARFIKVNILFNLESPIQDKNQWTPLINATGEDKTFYNNYKEPNQKNIIQFLTFDENSPNSIISCIKNARENARSVRGCLSTEAWVQINHIYNFINKCKKTKSWTLETLLDFYDEIISNTNLYFGILESTVSHDEEWYFSKLGLHIERIDKLSRLIDVKYYHIHSNSKSEQRSLDLIQWVSVLKSASAYEMYLKENSIPKFEKIIEFLFLKDSFPRSIRFSLIQAQNAIQHINESKNRYFTTNLEKKLGRLKTNFDFIEIHEIISFGLHEYIDRIQTRINEIDNLIYEQYFNVTTNLNSSKIKQNEAIHSA